MHIIAGRRSGKSSGCAPLAVFLSCLCDFSDCLMAGERGICLLIAETQQQASILLSYINGVLESSPALRKMIVKRTQTTIQLDNNIDIQVRSADFRALRGPTYIAVIADEICFWRNDTSLNPDTEIIHAVKPGLLTTRGMLCTIGSPYAKRGFAYDVWKRHFGKDGDPILVAHGGTRLFNSNIAQAEIDAALEEDFAVANAEFNAIWRSDVESLFDRDVVASCVIPGRHEIPPMAGVRYFAFADPSGGSSDDITLAIAHRENNITIVDCIRAAKPPFSPDQVCADFAATLKDYHLHSVKGDRYAGEWPVERFRHHGIRYESAQKPKVEIYKDSIPLFNGQHCELLDNQKLLNQLVSLERRTSRGGRNSIDHPAGANSHDDIANAVCGAMLLASAGKHVFRPTQRMIEMAGRPTTYTRRRLGDRYNDRPMRNGIPIV